MHSSADQSTEDPLDPVMLDVCNKRVVLLGEDSGHGSGKTMEVKIELIKRLINECQFSVVLFESSVYDFMHYQQSVFENSSSEVQLLQSIGGLWSKAKPMKKFASYLHNKAVHGVIQLGGFDSQFNANQPFSQKEMPDSLTNYLNIQDKQRCRDELYRYLNWQYDDENPYNDSVKESVKACVLAIKNEIDKQSISEREYISDQFLIDNFYRYLNFNQSDYFNQRDKSMADNVNWHLVNSPKNSKVIIWCATIHAAKKLTPISKKMIPMGKYLKDDFQDQMLSIGFSAFSGTYGRSESEIKTISDTDLERKAFLNSDKTIKYLDFEDLNAFGEIQAHPIGYSKNHQANWSDILDGMIVLRVEKPIEYLEQLEP